MSESKKTAIIYARWSSHEQSTGTTLQRQITLCEERAAREGWPIAETITDEGVSAWTGENLASGNLAKLATQILELGGENKVLIVEKLDRLSRQPAVKMLNWLIKFTSTGASICTADGRHQISADSLADDQLGVISIVFDAFRGFDESLVKSKRLSAAWKVKRERGKAMSSLCPAWLKAVGPTSIRSDQSLSHYELIPDRAELVRNMFSLALRGGRIFQNCSTPKRNENASLGTRPLLARKLH